MRRVCSALISDMKLVIVLLLLAAIGLNGYEKSETTTPAAPAPTATAAPAKAPVKSETSKWGLQSSAQGWCTYKRGSYTTSLPEPTTGCALSISVGASGIQ
ncbi:MAG: hypothetical protein RLZZ511_2395 [Cyanobacteriota bacterium]|jgi:hypothetical protein